MKSPKLEVLHHAPATPGNAPPLLFVHGAFVAAWCWEEHFLPWFAQRGYAAHALSLRGHGRSWGRELLDSHAIDDYVADLAEVAASLEQTPIVIGHSMGGYVVQKYLEQHDAAAAVLMCSVPPQGLLGSAVSMMFSKPSMLAEMNTLLCGGKTSAKTLQDALFAQDVSLDDLLRYLKHSQPESHRALWDMTLIRPPRIDRALAHLPHGVASLRIIGAELDHQIPVSAAHMTARSFNTEAHIYAGMGHGLMLEKDWENVAADLDAWFKALSNDAA